MEHKIVAAIAADRNSFERVNAHLEQSDFSPEGWHVVRAIRKFYKADTEAASADLSIVQRAVLRKIVNAKHTDMFEIYFQNVSQQDVSAVNVIDEVLEVKRASIELSLADAILSKERSQVELFLDKLAEVRASETLETAVHEEYSGVSPVELVKELDSRNLIRVAPASLNKRLGGGVQRGTSIVVVARPEAGKTAIALTMIGGFAQDGRKILYIGNEDPIRQVMMRMVSNLTMMSAAEIHNDPDRAREIAGDAGYDNIVFAGVAGGTLEDIRMLCSKHTPDVLIVDQIRNLTTNAENRTNQLETVSRGMRNLAREYDMVSISITQAGDSASGKLILDMGDIDGSNTGIPGACDILLMSGTNQSYDDQDLRMFKLAKNKASGNHENWTVGLDRVHSRVRDVGNL